MRTDSYIPLGSKEIALPKEGNCLFSVISLCQSGKFLLLVQKSQAGKKQGSDVQMTVHFIQTLSSQIRKLSCPQA